MLDWIAGICNGLSLSRDMSERARLRSVMNSDSAFCVHASMCSDCHQCSMHPYDPCIYLYSTSRTAYCSTCGETPCLCGTNRKAGVAGALLNIIEAGPEFDVTEEPPADDDDVLSQVCH